MKKLLIIVFCKFYGSLKEDFNAMGLLTVLMSTNIFTIVGYYQILILHEKNIMLLKIYEIPTIVIVGVFNYLFFLRNKKYEIMFKEFKQNPSMSGVKGSFITATYIIVTLGILAGLIWVN